MLLSYHCECSSAVLSVTDVIVTNKNFKILAIFRDNVKLSLKAYHRIQEVDDHHFSVIMVSNKTEENMTNDTQNVKDLQSLKDTHLLQLQKKINK